MVMTHDFTSKTAITLGLYVYRNKVKQRYAETDHTYKMINNQQSQYRGMLHKLKIISKRLTRFRNEYNLSTSTTRHS
jgi:hypothetical protein